METLDKNTKKLSRLKAQLLDSPDANPSVQTRLLNCIEDATDETQKERHWVNTTPMPEAKPLDLAMLNI